MRKKWLVLALATFIGTEFKSLAQDPNLKLSDERILRIANSLYTEGSYFNAIDYYQRLKAKDERNPYYTYMLAECYRFTRDYVPAAHYYMETRSLARKVYKYATYYAGQMLKQQGEYDQAIELFKEFLEDNRKATQGYYEIGKGTMKDLKKKAQVGIDGCIMAKNSIKSPEAVTMFNAGPNVNTIYTELSPLPLGDSALLFSTLGRNKLIEGTRGKASDVKEHFLISQKQKGDVVDSFQWPLPFNDGGFGEKYKDFHVGNGCFSPGGERFYFSACRENPADSMQMRCQIYVSQFVRKDKKEQAATWEYTNKMEWSEPIPVPFDDPKWLVENKTMPYIAKVGKKEVLFFVSDRKLQSRGQLDIWYSIYDPKLEKYRRPANAGRQINTKADEITPYYNTKENRLYFATTGLKTMGGLDIYSADGGPSRYTNLKNMGYPINTSADELYFIKDPLGKPDAYVVSNRIGSFALKNPTCCNDIWRIQYEPVLAVMGKVVSKKNQELMPQTVVKMVDQKGEMTTYNSEDGNFIFSMARGHAYVLTGDKQGYTSSRASVSTMEVKRSDPSDTVHVTIFLDSIRSSFSVSNIYYDYDKATLRPESVASLDSVVKFLTDNPSITVEIYSYTDSKGRDDYNMALSQRRAQSVLDYLEKNGIDRARLTAKGFGSKNAAAPNTVGSKDNAEGRQLNRRTEFRIITDVPTRRVIYNSALPGSMDQQERNLRVEPEEDDEPANGAKPAPAANDEE